MQYRALTNINHDNVHTKAGELIELDDSTAAELMKVKAIEFAPKRFMRTIVVPGTAGKSD